jgi:hypothetical protein
MIKVAPGNTNISVQNGHTAATALSITIKAAGSTATGRRAAP